MNNVTAQAINTRELKELAATLNGIAEGKPWQYSSFDGWNDPSEHSSCPIEVYRSGYKIRLKPNPLSRTVNGHTLPPGAEWHRQDFTEDMLPPPYRPLMKGEIDHSVDEIDRNDGKGFVRLSGVNDHHCATENYSCHTRTTRPLPILTPAQIADGWVEWNGGECPVEPESVPAVMFIDTTKTDRKARDWSWCDNGEYDKIIAYRPDPLGPIRQAIADGNPVQWQTSVGTWTTYDKNLHTSPGWEHSRQWRIKPADIPLGPEDVPPFSVIRRKGQTDEYWHWRLISYVTGIGPVCADRGYNWEELATDYEINRSLANGKWDPTAWEPCRKEAP